MRIKFIGLDVTDRGLLIGKLSEHPQHEWRRLFEERFLRPSNYSSAFRKEVFAGWDASGLGPLFDTAPDDFNANYKSIAVAAADYANDELRRAEEKRADEQRAEAAEGARAAEELERLRQKARAIKFP